ncbi:hypothetical protein FTUN_3440 [Frigoriglobus tundricola]|uniref:Uncharacterized protein n=1 Tax=Frigoriglobus tundricola TaxID=2774151 RepID=A0A6M5YRB0_9BACT|nr:hypothetical protein FTUN_3440 [Frigoriglobus tundricola]
MTPPTLSPVAEATGLGSLRAPTEPRDTVVCCSIDENQCQS